MFLGFFYLPWCKYSMKEFDILKTFLNSSEGKILNLNLYLIDLTDKKDYMAENNIEEVPILYFYRNGIHI